MPRDSERDEREQATTNASEEHLQGNEVQAERESLVERVGDWLDVPLAFLALIWTILIVVELAFPVSPEVRERIIQVNFTIWIIFAVVFFVEFALAPNKLRFLQRNFLSALAVGLPFVRVVRVLQIAPVLRSASLVQIVVVAHRAAASAAAIFREQRFLYVLSLVVVTTLLSAAGVYFFERDVPGTRFSSFWEALWWAATLSTTINVGADPITLEGRVIGLLLRVFALAVFGYVTASIASFLVSQRVGGRGEATEDRKEIGRLTEEVQQLRATIERLERESRTTPSPASHRDDAS